MIESQVKGVEFIAANTDAQALRRKPCAGADSNRPDPDQGLGRRHNRMSARSAAIEDRDRIAEVLRGANMVFIATGMRWHRHRRCAGDCRNRHPKWAF